MSDLVGNPEDRFSRVEAHMDASQGNLFSVPPTIGALRNRLAACVTRQSSRITE